MSSKRYTEEFKIEAVKQVTERSYPVAEVAGRLGVSQHSLYVWLKDYGHPVVWQKQQSQADEMRRLKAELKRVTEERDILKKAAVDSIDRCNTICFNPIFGGGVWHSWAGLDFLQRKNKSSGTDGSRVSH